MALYIFIATPLSFWHHCEEPEKKTEIFDTEKITHKSAKATFNKEARKCLICGFEYSPIINDLIFSSLPITCSYPTPFIQQILSKETAFNALHTNKGPPNPLV